MKTSKEMAEYVIRMRDEHLKKRELKLARIKRITTAGTFACAACAVLICAFNLLPDIEKNKIEVYPQESAAQQQTSEYVYNSEPSDNFINQNGSDITSENKESVQEEALTEDKTDNGIFSFIENIAGEKITKPVVDMQSNPTYTTVVSSSKPIFTTAVTHSTSVNHTKPTGTSSDNKPVPVTSTMVSNTPVITSVVVSEPEKVTTFRPPVDDLPITTHIVVTTVTVVTTAEPSIVTSTDDLNEYPGLMPDVPGVDDDINSINFASIFEQITCPDGIQYTYTGEQIDKYYIMGRMHELKLNWYDESTYTEYIITAKVYDIENTNPNIYVAVKFGESDIYYIYRNSNYMSG